MRKLAAVLGVLFVMALAIGALGLTAFADADYPPDGDTDSPTTLPVTPTTEVGNTTVTTKGPSVGAGLAFTGSDSKPLVFGGIVAVTVGAVAVVGTRRRGSTQARKLSS